MDVPQAPRHRRRDRGVPVHLQHALIALALLSGCETFKALSQQRRDAPAVVDDEPARPAKTKKRRAAKKKPPAPVVAAAPAPAPEAPPTPAEPEPEPAVRGRVSALTRKATLVGAGELSKDELREVVALRIAAVERCYDRGLVQRPALAGKMTLAFTVDAGGQAGAARAASSSLADAAVVDCVVAEVRTWRFPAPRGDGAVDVELPLVFETR